MNRNEQKPEVGGIKLLLNFSVKIIHSLLIFTYFY